jgi:predicted nucleic acid-binding protein
MTEPYVDTDVLIRLLTGDDPRKQADAAALFEAVEAGTLALRAPDTVIADAVFVLASSKWYALPRAQVASLLTPLVRLPNFRVDNKRTVLQALAIYPSTRLDFGDAMIVAAMLQEQAPRLYSYDRDFDRVPGITREEPPPRSTPN